MTSTTCTRDRRKQNRWLGLTLILLLIAVSSHASSFKRSAKNRLTDKDVRALFEALLERVPTDGSTHRHSVRLFGAAGRFAIAEKADRSVVQAAAVLHDSAKDDGGGTKLERFCAHGAESARYASEVLNRLEKPADYVERVAETIRQHMGPRGHNRAFDTPRLVSKLCGADYDFENPSSIEAKVLYDIDMLDLMSVHGLVQAVQMRQASQQRNPSGAEQALGATDLPVWQVVYDAHQTLMTDTARDCGRELLQHTRGFLDSVDWTELGNSTELARRVAEYLAAEPLPACLPSEGVSVSE